MTSLVESAIYRSHAAMQIFNNDSRHVVIMPKKRPGGGGEGDFAYEGGTDARRIA